MQLLQSLRVTHTLMVEVSLLNWFICSKRLVNNLIVQLVIIHSYFCLLDQLIRTSFVVFLSVRVQTRSEIIVTRQWVLVYRGWGAQDRVSKHFFGIQMHDWVEWLLVDILLYSLVVGHGRGVSVACWIIARAGQYFFLLSQGSCTSWEIIDELLEWPISILLL